MKSNDQATRIVRQGGSISIGLLAVSVGVFAEALICAVLGQDALAAFGLAVPVTVILFSLALGVNTGTAVETAAAASGDQASAIAAGFVSQITLACVVAVSLIAGAAGFASLAAATSEIERGVTIYLKAWSGLFLLASVSFAGVAVLQGIGKAGLTGSVMMVKTLVGVACSAVFGLGMFGMPSLGLLGVVIGGAFGQLAGAVHVGVLLHLHFNGSRTVQTRAILEKVRGIIRIGTPAGASQALDPIALMLVATAAGFIGTDVLAVHTLLSRIERILMVPGVSMGIAAVPAMSAREAENDRLQAEQIARFVGAFLSKYIFAIWALGLSSFLVLSIARPDALSIDWVFAGLIMLALTGPLTWFMLASAQSYARKKPARVAFASGFYSLCVVPLAAVAGIYVSALSVIYALQLVGMIVAARWLTNQVKV